ncbi:hypothetical protein Bca52824_037407 [Brassica carinata]|uniref:RRM domain-containing protein n=1 Tax=Brassica carinata TaxID=52824 RepID=A0A8X7S6P9_BRACI|nr:hypothetical protein Bca52824_037407 [Brassica carinata]
MMQHPPPGGLLPHHVPPPSAQQHYGYQQPPPYGMPGAPPPPQMWNPQTPSSQPTTADEIRTLWIGDLQFWMDENFLYSCFAHTGEVVSVKVIRNKQTSQVEGYGFIEFVSHAAAERALQTYNNTPVPGLPDQLFRLNWASLGSGDKRDDSPDYTIFVGDLAADVTDYVLLETFRASYPSVKGAKVVIDRATGRTKGYGFVRFSDESEQIRAMSEMNGVPCSTRPMRIGPAASKKGASGQRDSYQSAASGVPTDNDPNNTTVFVGGLDPTITDDHLKNVFSQYGEIVHVKIPAGKRCGFVQFTEKSCAEEAIRTLNGMQLGGTTVRLSWGRSPSSKQAADPSQYYYGGYGQGQEHYGYSMPQDPNAYYGGYPGGYQQPPQVGQQPPQQPPQQQHVGFSY